MGQNNQGNGGGGNGGGAGGQGGGQGRNSINLERVADDNDVVLDLSAGTDTATAEIDLNGDGTADETDEVNVPNGDSYTIRGNDGDNTIIGSDADETLIGSSGDDTFVGGDGIDTIDYSDLGQAVTLNSGGVLEKGDLGTDTVGEFDIATGVLVPVETIIGAEGENNVADNTLLGGTLSVDIDLAEETFVGTVTEDVGGFAEGDSFSVTLENFVDVVGSQSDDTVTGDNQANLLTGAEGTDTISGAGGSDTIDGGTGDDVLTGGGGADVFEFTAGDGADTITDFDVGNDQLSFDGVQNVDVSADTDGTDTTVTYGNSEILLADVVEDDLSSLLAIV